MSRYQPIDLKRACSIYAVAPKKKPRRSGACRAHPQHLRVSGRLLARLQVTPDDVVLRVGSPRHHFIEGASVAKVCARFDAVVDEHIGRVETVIDKLKQTLKDAQQAIVTAGDRSKQPDVPPKRTLSFEETQDPKLKELNEDVAGAQARFDASLRRYHSGIGNSTQNYLAMSDARDVLQSAPRCGVEKIEHISNRGRYSGGRLRNSRSPKRSNPRYAAGSATEKSTFTPQSWISSS